MTGPASHGAFYARDARSRSTGRPVRSFFFEQSWKDEAGSLFDEGSRTTSARSRPYRSLRSRRTNPTSEFAFLAILLSDQPFLSLMRPFFVMRVCFLSSARALHREAAAFRLWRFRHPVVSRPTRTKCGCSTSPRVAFNFGETPRRQRKESAKQGWVTGQRRVAHERRATLPHG